MRSRRFIAFIVALVAAIGLGVVAPAAAAPAQSAPAVSAVLHAGNVGALAIPDSDISQDWVHSTAYRVGNGTGLRFYGALQAHDMPHTSVEGCYEMQQLTPGGTWTEAGFFQAQTGDPENPMIHCNYWPATNSLWRINDGLSVRGIRFVKVSGNGSAVGTHCNTATTCRNMYQGTLAASRLTKASYTLAS